MARILPKKERTLETYKQVGAEVRLMKAVTVKAACSLGGVLTSDEYAKVSRALSLLDEAVSRADDRLFRDHPDIADEYTSVFYGHLGGAPISPLDEEMHRRAKEYADGIFA